MRVEEKDTPALKQWLIKRLDNISDADSDVLADYALVLVKTDEPDDVLRTSCVEGLQDFLHDNTEAFVQDVLRVLRTKEYLPNHKSKQQRLSAQAASFQPQGPRHANGQHSKKRAFSDRKSPEAGEARQNFQTPGERPQKQLKRGGNRGDFGGRGNRGDRGGRHSQNGFPSQMNMNSNMYGMPPAGMLGYPHFDPNNDPMTAMMAMQAMGFPPLPGFPQLPGQGSPPPQAFEHNGQRPQSRPGQRCRSYDEDGYCERGARCPFIHESTDQKNDMNDEYDPSQAPIFPQNGSITSQSQLYRKDLRSNPRGGSARGRGNHRGGRSAISFVGQNHDRNNTSIVVEQIPEDKFTEETVRSFFSDFGSITDVSMQPYKRLAVVTYEDYDSARAAYESPKVIFDNRFVKVFWHKPGTDPSAPSVASTSNGSLHKPHYSYTQDVHEKSEDTDMPDPEEFAKRQEEAQRVHEEKAKKLQEAAAAKEKLDAQIKAQAEERRKLMEKLAAKTGGNPDASMSSPPAGGSSAGGAHANGTTNGTSSSPSISTESTSKETSQTAALRAKLASLEAEAATMGLQAGSTDSTHTSPPPYNGYPSLRGRGRGGFAPRGRGSSFRGRGSWRGGYAGGAGAGAVSRLDNRPKTVALTALDTGVDFEGDGGKAEEALRVFLFGIGSFVSIAAPSSSSTEIASATSPATDSSKDTKDPKTTRVIAFDERYVAENFIASAKQNVPGIGKVNLSWISSPLAPPATTSVRVSASPIMHPEPEPSSSSGKVGSTDEPFGEGLGRNGQTDASEGAYVPASEGMDVETSEAAVKVERGPAETKMPMKAGGKGERDNNPKDLDVADDEDSEWL